MNLYTILNEEYIQLKKILLEDGFKLIDNCLETVDKSDETCTDDSLVIHWWNDRVCHTSRMMIKKNNKKSYSQLISEQKHLQEFLNNIKNTKLVYNFETEKAIRVKMT